MQNSFKNANTSNMAQTDGAVNSVIRAMSILDILGKYERELGITEIGEELCLHKSTVYRLISTLEKRGYIKQNLRTGKYFLGLHLMELGMAVLNQLDLRRVASPYLNELREKTDEVVHLGILDQDQIVYIDKIDIERPLTMGSKIGGRSPGYCTGLGKVLLANLPQDKLEKMFMDTKLYRFTPNTITDYNLLLEHFARIREQGYAIDDEEHELGIRCLAAPIKDYRGEVIAAISVSGPTLRMTREKVDLIGPIITAMGEKISKSLGYSE